MEEKPHPTLLTWRPGRRCWCRRWRRWWWDRQVAGNTGCPILWCCRSDRKRGWCHCISPGPGRSRWCNCTRGCGGKSHWCTAGVRW